MNASCASSRGEIEKLGPLLYTALTRSLFSGIRQKDTQGHGPMTVSGIKDRSSWGEITLCFGQSSGASSTLSPAPSSQLLHCFMEHVRKWGWISTNSHSNQGAGTSQVRSNALPPLCQGSRHLSSPCVSASLQGNTSS